MIVRRTIKMAKLIFRKGKVIKTEKVIRPNGKIYNKPIEWKGRGYFFKGEFLHLYKNEAINILRKRVEEAGRKESDKLSPLNPDYKIPFQIGKEILKDEAQIVIKQQEEINRRTKQTEETKKSYYELLRVEARLKKIEKLQKELDQLRGQNPETQRVPDEFKISSGNRRVLEMIPAMMENPKYRKELRRLSLHYLQEETLKHHAERGFI